MRILFLLIFFTFYFENSVESQDTKTNSKKIIYWVYDGEGTKLSGINSSDTLDMTLDNLNDSTYQYRTKDKKGKGWWNIDFTYYQKTKKASYIIDNIASSGDDDESIPVRRDTFKVKFINYKLFELYDNDKKYVVYRYLVHTDNYEYSESLIFWTKEFGIIMKKGLNITTLVRFEYLNDEERNTRVRHLCFLINSDPKFYNLNDWAEKIKE